MNVCVMHHLTLHMYLYCRYYFVDGHALNDRPRLAKTVAEKLKTLLDDPPSAEELLNFLNSNEGRKEIEDALQTLDQMGVHGIPKFIIEGKTVVDGAARSEVFVEIFREIEQRGEIHSGPIFGEILGISKETVEAGSHHGNEEAA